MDLSKMHRGANVASPTYDLLGHINGQTFGGLQAETGLSKSTLKYQLRQLFESGYISKEPDEDDKRKTHYHRTETGERALATKTGFCDLPSPRAGWKRSDPNHLGQPRYQKTYRREDGSIGYGRAPRSRGNQVGSTSDEKKGQPPTSTKSRYLVSLTSKDSNDSDIGDKGVDPILTEKFPSPHSVFPLASPAVLIGSPETWESRDDRVQWPPLTGEDLEWAKVMVARGVLSPHVLKRGT
jgi:DNA-binding PadR family transcriptional regulator